MKQFLCECRKTKGKLLSILLPVLALILVWSFWLLHDPGREMCRTGYTYMTTTLLLLNSIFLPLTIGVMASRLMDMENKGSTYKLLCTLQSKSGIFLCKLLLASAHLFLFFLLETAAIRLIGALIGLTESFPFLYYLRLQGIGFLTGVLLFILQIFFSLRFENQLYSMFIGLIGSFLSLFSMFLPIGSIYAYFCPWSYFTFGGCVIMNYDEATSTHSYTQLSFNTAGFIVLLLVTAAAYIAVRSYFLRKED